MSNPRLLAPLCVSALAGLLSPLAAAPRQREGIEWVVSYHYNATDTRLPRVLLVGDSITNGYHSLVRDKLAGVANVSYLATSKCVTDVSYLRLLSYTLGECPYQVVHFNNGLHSLDTDRPTWIAALRDAFRVLREEGGGAKLIWATSTPLKDPALTAKAVELNGLAAPLVAELGLPTNDLFALMDPLDRAKYWSDTFHYGNEGKELQATQVVAAVKPLLAGFQPPAAAAGEALKNAGFETAGGWNLYPPKPEAGTLEWTTDRPHGGQRAARVNAQQAGVQFYQHGPQLAAGGNYQLGFWARADQPRSIKVHLRTQKPPYVFYGEVTCELTAEWQEFRTTFQLPADYDPGAHVLFFNLSSPGVYDFDDLQLH
ncbi:MAG: carbohydrate binding domain-containing protein [Fimbriimonadaceae bacterium]|nr:carbohydrate binding domain-containing protein [Fimbriimonadaceae bacterium]